MGSDDKYYFNGLSGLYSFDHRGNVYYADGTLMHNALFDSPFSGVPDPNFYIDGIPYWFEGGGLMSQGIGGTPYRVQTLQKKDLGRLDPYQTPEGLQTSQGNMVISQSNSHRQLYSNLEPVPSTMPISHEYYSGPDSMLIDEGGQDELQASPANLPRVKLNDPTSSNLGSKRKRVAGNPVQSLSTKTSVVDNLGAGDSMEIDEAPSTAPMHLPGPQQHLRPRDPEVTPPPTPEKYHFYASGRRYYVDQSRKLYSEAGKLLYDVSSSFQTDASSLPNFQIDGVSYWFGSDGLLCRDVDGTHRRVLTWPSKWESLDQPLPGQISNSQNDPAILQSNPNPGFFDEFNFIPKTILASDGCDPLQKGLQWGMVFSSPSSSTTRSPRNISTSNPNQLSEEQPPFAATEPSVIQGIETISTLQHGTTEPQEEDEDNHPAKKRRRGEPVLCPKCGKECRRPVTLREHLREHISEKPEVCPFDKCNRGFAARSSMRRHFLTHQIGPLEGYLPVYICPFRRCGENFNSQSDVIQHYLAHGIGPLAFCPPIYTCPFESYNEECDERFTTQQGVIQHALSHPPNRCNLPGEAKPGYHHDIGYPFADFQ